MLYTDHVYFGKTFRMRENTKDTSTTGTTLWPAVRFSHHLQTFL